MKNMRTIRLGGALFITALVLLACQTEPPEIPENLSQPEFFQRAQDAADENNWEVALHYYETFLQRYPEDEANRIAAEYEIAFIHYKMEEYDTSKRLFQEILGQYEEDEDNALPEWPRILSEKLVDRIDEEIRAEEAGLLGALDEAVPEAPGNGETENPPAEESGE